MAHVFMCTYVYIHIIMCVCVYIVSIYIYILYIYIYVESGCVCVRALKILLRTTLSFSLWRTLRKLVVGKKMTPQSSEPSHSAESFVFKDFERGLNT